MEKGRLIVVSGPSGVGKTTIVERLENLHKGKLFFSKSFTSRKPRGIEKHGVEYFFLSVEEFEDGIKHDKFLEWAKVFDNYYGTNKDYVNDLLTKGFDCILNIDVQGAIKLMDKKLEAIFIFIAPPSIEVLKERLSKRGTDSEEIVVKRLKIAINELEYKNRYDHIIINDNLEKAVNDIDNLLY